MTAIFRTPSFRTEVAGSFIKEAGDAATRLFMIIGREDDPRGTKYIDGSIFSAGDGEWLDDTAPPTPENSVDQDRDLWDMAIAGKYVSENDVVFGLPRTNEITKNYMGVLTDFTYSVLWDDLKDTVVYAEPASRVYEPYKFDTTNGDENFENHNILINSDREVWLCVDRGEGADVTGVESDYVLNELAGDVPFLSLHASDFEIDTEFFNDGTNSILKLGFVGDDAVTPGVAAKYTWKFICRINEDTWDSILNEQSNWVPINYASTVVTAPFEAGGEYPAIDTQDAFGDGLAPFILSLRHVLIRSLLTVSSTPGDGLPGNMNFRQIFLVRDPIDPQTGNPALFDFGYMPNSNPAMSPLIDGAYADSGDYSLDPDNGDITTFTKYSGRILYVENRQPIYRQADQTEEVFTVFSY